MQIAKPLKTGFSTADAEFPEIHQADGDVVLSFRDWQERLVRVFFADAIAFKWQMAEIFFDEERDDLCYEMLNSSWLSLHIEQGIVSKSENYKHYKFNFNSCGQFEVLALSYTVNKEKI